MRKINWMADSLNVRDIIDLFIDGDQALSTDKEFFDVILSLLINDNLSHRANILDLICLDEYDIRGELLKKLWELTDKNQDNFNLTISFLRNCFTQTEIMNNLSLEKPVEFISNSLLEEARGIFDNGIYSCDNDKFLEQLKIEFFDRFNQELDREGLSLEHMEFVKTSTQDVASMDPDEELNLKKLYYGIASYDLSGGVLGLNMTHGAWFEQQDQSWKFGDEVFLVFREIPSGEYVLFDQNGVIHELDEEKTISDGITILSTNKVRSAKITRVGNIVRDSRNKINEMKGISPEIDSTLPFVEGKSLAFWYCTQKKIKVEQLNDFERFVRPLYEFSYGKMFDDEKGNCKSK